VEIAMAEQDGLAVAFFPFQRSAFNRAVPVGGIVSDYQGIIARAGFVCDAKALLKSCGLAAYDFDRLLASQKTFLPYHKFCEPSALIDLSRGYDAYVSE